MMQERDREILETFARRVRERFPESRIWGFGSKARGDATGGSDFDICVVLDRLTPEVKSVVRRLSWEVAFENGQVFNTVLFSIQEFEEGPMSESTLKENILREGVAA
jgi:predicted nucleotidyltransferase